MKILVTGGAGFIGSNFVRRTLQDAYPGLEGAEVVVLDALTYSGNLANLAPVADSPRYTFVKGDIRDGGLLDELFPTVDAVVHFAAESHVDRSVRDASIFVETNVLGTQQLLDAALRNNLKRFVHVSTDEVYGSLGADGLFREDTPYAPTSPYSASKASADHLALAWFHTYGLPVVVSNCSNNYGPYHFPEKLIPLVILNALDQRELPVYGDGGQVRDWLFVEDHARALRLILERGRPGQKYNVGARSERTNLKVVETICDLVDAALPASGSRRRLIRLVADRPGHDRRYAIDPSKTETELGWRPQESFESGLARTVRWYIDNADWWRPLRARYSGERLGLSAQG